MPDLRKIFLMLSLSFALGVRSYVAEAGFVSQLSIDTVAGPYGSGSGSEHGDTVSPATAATSLAYNLSEPGGDGSYAHANVLATFGHLHAYADAHRTYNTNLGPTPPLVGNAQAKAWVRMIDYVQASSSSPVGYVGYSLGINIHGTHALDAFPDAVFGVAIVNYDIYDETAQQSLTFGTWTSSDAVPSALISQSISAPQDHLLQIRIDFEADAFVMSNNSLNHLTAFSDYYDTVDVTLQSLTPGGNTVGQSGHNYGATTVPEPAAVIHFAVLLGMVVTVCGLRRETQSVGMLARANREP
jgi:hypothetical protein